MTITARNETPATFDAAGEDLVGVLTRPDGAGNGLTILTLYGTGPFPAFGRNRVGVTLARQLAGMGYHAFRFDYRGAGDSGGPPRDFDVNHPWVDDALGAVRWLEGQGLERIVIVSVCFGSRTALAAANQIQGLAGLLMIAPPVGQLNHTETILRRPMRWYLKRAVSLRRLRGLVQGPKARRRRELVAARMGRVFTGAETGENTHQPGAELSRLFFEPLRVLVEADLPVMLVFGRKDDFFYDFERALDGPLGKILNATGARTTLRIVDGHAANVASVEAQRTMLAIVTDWAESLPLGQSGTDEPAVPAPEPDQVS